MKFKIVILCLLILSRISYTETDLVKMIHNLEKSSISFEVVELKSKSVNSSLIGSGFLVIRNSKTYAITNTHVYRSVKPNENLMIGLNTNVGKVYGYIDFITESVEKDIAVFEFKNLVKNLTGKDEPLVLDQLKVGISLFTDNKEIQPGMEVVSLGYPLRIGSGYISNSPVVRSGMVALGVDNLGYFLLDGISNPGNSGSPIFESVNGKLLGMISGGPQDIMEAYDKYGNLIMSLPYNSGLTSCISAKEIQKLIP